MPNANRTYLPVWMGSSGARVVKKYSRLKKRWSRSLSEKRRRFLGQGSPTGGVIGYSETSIHVGCQWNLLKTRDPIVLLTNHVRMRTFLWPGAPPLPRKKDSFLLTRALKKSRIFERKKTVLPHLLLLLLRNAWN